MFKSLETYIKETEREQTPTDPIAAAILKGIKKANDKYRSWSNGYWLSDAGVESVMQTYVAEACFAAVQDQDLHVHLEAPLSYFFDKAEAAKNRLDIAITDGDEIPRYVIELKRGVSGEWRDAEKFNQVLVRWRTPCKEGLRAAYWGQFVPWKTGSRSKSLDSKIEVAIGKFESLTNLDRLKITWNSRFLAKGSWPGNQGRLVEWQAAALVATITRKA